MDFLGADNCMEDTRKVVHVLLHGAALEGFFTLMVAIIPIVMGKTDRFKEVTGKLVHSLHAIQGFITLMVGIISIVQNKTDNCKEVTGKVVYLLQLIQRFFHLNKTNNCKEVILAFHLLLTLDEIFTLMVATILIAMGKTDRFKEVTGKLVYSWLVFQGFFILMEQAPPRMLRNKTDNCKGVILAFHLLHAIQGFITLMVGIISKAQNKTESQRKVQQLEQRNEELEEKRKHQNEYATELDRYKMEEGKRGICLVINNYNFPEGRERHGAEIDEKNIVDLFRDELDFEVEVLQDLPGSEILKEAKKLAARDLSQFKVLVFIIMSHGDKDAIEGVDGALVKVARLMSQFSVTGCRTLWNKPKLFFIQACRGQLSDPRKDRLPTPLVNTGGDGIAMMLCPDSALANGVTPLEADFLLSFATAPGYKAWRNPKKGSWYIEILADVIRKYHRHHDVLDMLTEVNKQVAAIPNDRPEHDLSFQVPAHSHTLRAKVFL